MKRSGCHGAEVDHREATSSILDVARQTQTRFRALQPALHVSVNDLQRGVERRQPWFLGQASRL